MRVKNIATGIRGLHAKSGFVDLNPGEERDDLDIDAGELASAQATGYFEFDGAASSSDDQAADEGDDLDTTLDGLEKIAKDEGIDLSAVQGTGKNGNVLKSDVQGAIRTARAAKAAGGTGGDELDAMDDDTLRTTVQAITGTEAPADADRAALLALARGNGS